MNEFAIPVLDTKQLPISDFFTRVKDSQLGALSQS